MLRVVMLRVRAGVSLSVADEGGGLVASLELNVRAISRGISAVRDGVGSRCTGWVGGRCLLLWGLSLRIGCWWIFVTARGAMVWCAGVGAWGYVEGVGACAGVAFG